MLAGSPLPAGWAQNISCAIKLAAPGKWPPPVSCKLNQNIQPRKNQNIQPRMI